MLPPFDLLALTDAQLGILATAFVGSIAALAGALTAWANRSHERQLARAQRLYAQRHGAYLELTRFLEHQRLVLDRTEPMIGPVPDPPPALGDDVWLDLAARAQVLASDEVQAAMQATRERFRLHRGRDDAASSPGTGTRA